jgi:hypothetical protein
MHQVLAGAGLVDSWTVLGHGTGLTCCHAADLSNPLAAFTQRIDYVWERGLEQPHAGLQGQADLVGDASRDKVAGPVTMIWPSDHAGLVVKIVAH